MKTAKKILTQLEKWSQEKSDQTAFTFVVSDTEEHITYKELSEKTKELAQYLLVHETQNERVFLYFSSEINFIIALLACFQVDAIAVPLKRPNPRKFKQEFKTLYENCSPKLILSDEKYLKKIAKETEDYQHLNWFAYDHKIYNTEFSKQAILNSEKESIAYLQFTSGSTSQPKGVIVKYEQLESTINDIHNGLPFGEQGKVVSWLPFYHDMGLVFGILLPLYYGVQSIISPPTSFIKNPLSWLDNISKYKGTHTSAPNFAFDLCVKAQQVEKRTDINLSSLEVLVNGAEFIKANSLRIFQKTFKGTKLKEKVLSPGYGMAETVLKVSGIPKGKAYSSLLIDRNALENEIVRIKEILSEETSEIISCGKSAINAELRIVDIDGNICSENKIGEIWVKSTSVASGYWNDIEKTQEVFHNYTTSGEGPFLKTGDLGFLNNNEVYITGRVKDLIILNGRNVYPQDLESVASNASEYCYENATAAFSILENDDERVVVIQELNNITEDYLTIASTIRDHIFQTHEIVVTDVVLVRRSSIRKTSSGKIQRNLNKKLYLEDGFSTLFSLKNDQKPNEESSKEVIKEEKNTKKAVLIFKRWLTRWISEITRINSTEIRTDLPFSYYKLGSLEMIKLASDLGKYFNKEIPASIGFDYPTIQALSAHFFEETSKETKPKKVVIKTKRASKDIAVIGMGCRFPKIKNLKEFWDFIKKGKNAIQEVPETRWNINNYYDDNREIPGKTYSKYGVFLEDITAFDPEFFHISNAEANYLDPRHRILLEVCWHALEDANLKPNTLDKKTGIFLGVNSQDEYLKLIENSEAVDNPYIGTGNSSSTAAGRISHLLNLNGPSIAIDTACSSSLVALHMACQSLRTGESTTAIAGGVNLTLAPEAGLIVSKMNLLSPEGQCKAFSNSADGYVRGEGCGLVILKPLEDAIAEGLSVKAIIKGSAINHDGKSQSLTAPNLNAQVGVIKAALQKASITPNTINYVEAHGSGTMLGDAIEVTALQKTYGENRSRPLTIGSVKSNIGHLETAAGIAGFIKAVLSIQHKELIQSLHYNTPNKNINWQKDLVTVVTKNSIWKKLNGTPRRAGISSFGFSGTNAHVIIEEAKNTLIKKKKELEIPYHLLKLSAPSKLAFEHQIKTWKNYLKETELPLKDIVFSANVGRTEFEYRQGFVFQNKQDLIEKFENFKDSTNNTVTNSSTCFVFSGQGTQYHKMCQELYNTNTFFKSIVDKCAKIIQKNDNSIDIVAVLFSSEFETEINETYLAQPTLFIIEYALAKLWMSWGVQPQYVVGHSLGEITAACVGGYLTLEDALYFVLRRGALMQSAPKEGSMLVVLCDKETLLPFITSYTKTINIAAENQENQIVISGKSEDVNTVNLALKRANIPTKFLNVSHAFHSPLMKSIKDDFREMLRKITFKKGTIPLVSNVTGKDIEEIQISDPLYWWNHLRNTVQFKTCVEILLAKEVTTFIEIGPKQNLLAMIALQAPNAIHINSIQKKSSNWESLLSGAATLFEKGYTLDWKNITSEYGGRWTTIPLYQFNKKRCWFSEGTQLPKSKNTNTSKKILETKVDKSWWKHTTKTDRTQEIEIFLRKEIGNLLQQSITENQLETPLNELSFDSLMTVRLRNRFIQYFAKEVPLAAFLTNNTIALLASVLASNTNESSKELPLPIGEVSEFPLSFAQKRLYFLQKITPDVAAWNQTCQIALFGALNIQKLEKSLLYIQQRHPLLRAILKEVENDTIQYLSDEKLALQILNFQSYPKTIQEGIIETKILELARTPFQLEKELPIRTYLIREDITKSRLVLIYHHSISDGWGLLNILLKEIATCYAIEEEKWTTKLPALSYQYQDFVQWQTGNLQDKESELKTYWTKQLENIPEVPTLFQRKTTQTNERYQGEKVHRKFSIEFSELLDTFSKAQKTTVFNVWMSTIYTLLSRFSGKKDLIIGIPVSNRTQEAFETILGDFTNFLPLRIQVNRNDNFLDIVQNVNTCSKEAIVHSEYPFENIVKDVCSERDLMSNPLFNVAVAMHNYIHNSVENWGDITAFFTDPLGQYDNKTSELDLIFEIANVANQWIIECEFDTTKYSSEIIVSFLETLQNVLEYSLKNPTTKLSEIPILSKEEQLQFISSISKKSKKKEAKDTLYTRFQEKVRQFPNNVAVIEEDKEITYKELNEKANAVANTLLLEGVQIQDTVGILLNKSIDFVAAMLGILKVGGCYVPLDPNHPSERLEYQLYKSNTNTIITEQFLANKASKFDGKRIYSNEIRAINEATAPKIDNDFLNAYIIFTSGSSGKSKAVAVTHANVMQLFEQTEAMYEFSEKDVWSFFHSQAFDFSVWEIWGALLYGGKLVIVPSETAKSSEDFYNTLTKHKVTFLNQTPSAFKNLLQSCEFQQTFDFSQIRWIVFGGEALDKQIVNDWYRLFPNTTTRLANMYGITETTVHVTFKEITYKHLIDWQLSCIGKALPEMTMFLLDENMQPVPNGVQGELYVGGSGLSNGYVNSPELTAKVFVPNPFAIIPGERLYKTGDAAIINAEGNYQYIGRIDEQVKIRGYRVEPGEIKDSLLAHSKVKNALVTIVNDGELVAYIQPSENNTSEEKNTLDWKEVFELNYSDLNKEIADFDVYAGWKSSYTKENIPTKEMDSWTAQVVAQLHDLKPKKILEIGCGSGLLLEALYENCEAYYGIDISKNSIAYLQHKYAEHNHIHLEVKEAHEIDQIKEADFDLIIINSVIQYFSGIEYLETLFPKMVTKLSTTGTIFIGDVRDYRLFDEFTLDILSYQRETSEIEVIDIETEKALETELLIAPNYFTELQKQYSELHQVEIRLKKDHYQNEMSLFRYDVVLSVTKSEEYIVSKENCVEWNSSHSIDRITNILKENTEEVFVLKNIPNPYLAKLSSNVLKLNKETQVEIEKSGFEGITFSEITDIPTNYKVKLLATEDKTKFDAIFYTSNRNIHLVQEFSEIKQSFNQPIQSVSYKELRKELRTYAKVQLPSYMIPSYFMIVKEFPLTINGKIAIKKLPKPQKEIINNTFEAPENAIQEMVAEIWETVLNIEKVSINSNFFEIGGHSLLATNVLSRIRKVFQIKIPVKFILECQTIKAQEAYITKKLSDELADDFFENETTTVTSL